MSQNLKDIVSGFISGWAQVILMQPFEIVKVRLQTQSASSGAHYNGMVDCFKKITLQEGPLAFYKGTLTPLIGIGFYASSMFFTYEFSKRYFSRFKENPKDRLPLHFVALSGMIASLPSSLITGPVQHFRIRIQIQKGQSSGHAYQGSVDAAVKITKQYGARGFLKGFFPTWGREAFGQALYFGVYEAVVRSFIRKDQKPTDAPLAVSLIGGAAGGISFWILGYPWDLIKTLMQTDSLENPKYKTMRAAFSEQLAKGNPFKTFYNGIGVVFLRAIFAGSGGFFAFQASARALGRAQQE